MPQPWFVQQPCHGLPTTRSITRMGSETAMTTKRDCTIGPRWAFTALALGLLGSVMATAQQLQPLTHASGEVREEAYDHLRRALSGSDRVYESIDGRRMKTWLNEIVAISRQSRDDGNRYWGRISGTKYEAMTADWTEEKFRSLGLTDIHRVEFELGPQWFPTDWDMTATSGDTRLSFSSVNPATRSPSLDAIEAEAVWVGLGTAADFAGRDVEGKAVVIQTILAPGQMGNSASWEGATVRAQEAGAALIIGVWGYGGNFSIWQSTRSFQMVRDPDGTSRYVGTNVATPGFFMGFEDGKELRDLVAAGEPVTISASIETETREGLKSPSIYGTLPGATDEKIYVMAHMDGYYDAALDNASGMAVMIALAEYYSKVPADQRRRSITFIGTAGHHVGSPNAPYLRDEGLLKKTALMVNCEHVAPTQFVPFNNELRLTNTVSPRRWWVHGSRRLLDITLDAYGTFGVTVIGEMDGRATGEMMAIDKEAPSIQLIRSPEHKHTDGDVPALVPAAGLEAVGRAFAKIIDEVNELDISELEAASPTAQTTGGWEPVPAERLLDPEDGDWMNYRRTYDVTGFSPLDQVNRSNVDELRLVWSHSMGDGSRWIPTPVVVNGLMYVAESDRITAFEVVTGDVAWVHQRSYPEDIQNSQARGRSRGVSVYGDLVYWGTADAALVAIDARTGEQAWEVSTGDYSDGLGHAHPALIADGKVVLGFAGGDRLTRGLVVAHDAETGEHVWTTYTVPREGEPGWESWTEREIPPMGGGTWGTISYDPELGLVYLGTGQPTPWASTLRGPGDALYTNSILALDIGTGELEWHFQVVPADNWDLDATHESMLVDLDIGGRTHKSLIETSKIGWGIVLDRETGRFLHAFRTGYDNIITGWTDSGSPIYNPALIPTMDDVDSDKVFEVCPHYHGTRNLNAPSYSPQTGLYYLGINNSCMDVTFISEEAQPGQIYRGVGTRPKPVPGYDYVGECVAFNPVTGQRAWEYRHPDGAAMTASALATAGGIVFGGTADRRLFALDAETGDHLWETRLNGDISGAPVTFEVDGRQYLAVGAGGRIAMTTSYALFTETTIPQGSGVMWVFALPE